MWGDSNIEHWSWRIRNEGVENFLSKYAKTNLVWIVGNIDSLLQLFNSNGWWMLNSHEEIVAG